MGTSSEAARQQIERVQRLSKVQQRVLMQTIDAVFANQGF
jgi:hypothetical protein